MIPLRAENTRRTFPVTTVVLILLNVAVFVYQITLPPKAADAMVTILGVVPARAGAVLKQPMPHDGLTGLLGQRGPIQTAALPLVTSMFLHGGWLHLLRNMLFLWVFGGSVEDRLGHFSYLGFYLFSGVASGVVHTLANLNSHLPSIGASGAISGVMGAYIVLFPLSKILTLIPVLILFFTVRIPAFLILGYWLLIQFLSGASALGQANQGGVAWWAHIGGFAVGFLAGVALRVDSAWSQA